MPLSDIERKVLRIIINVSNYGRSPKMPTVPDLKWRTGRSERGIYRVLAGLNHKGYIEWSRQEPHKIVLLRSEQ